MRPKTVVMVGALALFLYWVVQAPVGAATTIHGLFNWTLDLLTVVADRLVQFLDALF